jgi:hypothetical protein
MNRFDWEGTYTVPARSSRRGDKAWKFYENRKWALLAEESGLSESQIHEWEENLRNTYGLYEVLYGAHPRHSRKTSRSG